MATEPLTIPAYGGGELSALDELESAPRPRRRLPLRLWRGTWPRLAAVAIALVAWQLVALSGWRPDYLLPGPLPVLGRLATDLTQPLFYGALATTMERAMIAATTPVQRPGARLAARHSSTAARTSTPNGTTYSGDRMPTGRRF